MAKKKKAPLPFTHSKVKKYLSIRVQHGMNQANLSVELLAWKAGLSIPTVRRILNCEGVIVNNGGTLLGLAMALNVELGWLVDFKPTGRRYAGKSTKSSTSKKKAKKK